MPAVRDFLDLEWSDDLRERLRHVVRVRGVERVADEIPAGRRTVFRLLSGEVNRPSHAVLVGIVRVITAREEREAEWDRLRSKLRRS